MAAEKTKLLDAYIAKSGLRSGFIIEKLGITKQSFNNKRHGRTQFRAAEVYVLCDLLNIPDDDKAKIFFD